MKRLIIVTIVMVILLSIPGKAVADVWRRCGLRSSGRFQPGARRFLGGSFRIPSGYFRTPYGNVWNRCGLSSRGSGRNVYYGRGRGTLGDILVSVGSGMDVLQGFNQMSGNQAAG